MAVREIRLFGDPILKTVSQPITEITDSVRSLVVDLEQTTAITGRAGVAANQIGVNLRAFGYHVEGVVGHLINPEIIEQSGELVRNSVVALNTATQATLLVKLDEIEQHFKTRVRSVIRIPYDPALAAGSVIKFNELKKQTRDAARDLAAEVIGSIVTPQ